MTKQRLSPEEIEQKKQVATFNRRYAGFKRAVKSNIVENGLRKVELELEFLKEHPNNPLPKHYFDHKQTVDCIEEAINEYKEEAA